MVSSLPDSMAKQGRTSGGGWHRLLSCVSNIAETYKLLVPYRDQFIDIADEFSQKGDEAYKNRDDVSDASKHLRSSDMLDSDLFGERECVYC